MRRRALLIGLGLLVWAVIAAQDSGEEVASEPTVTRAAEERETARPEETRSRVVGTIIYPPRIVSTRVSSAQAIMTPETHYMIDKALDYLRKSQSADGSWPDKEWSQEVGVSSLGCLALMSDGSMPRVGPSGRELAKGVEFLLDSIREDGQIVARDTYKYGPMYGHAWGTLVLLQAYGNVPWRADMRDKIARAIQVILRFQKPDGGWRYKMMKEGESCTPVTINVLHALQVGIKAGFAIRREVLENGFRYVETNSRPDGLFLYRAHGLPGSIGLSGAGALTFHFQGKFNHPLLMAANNYISYYHKRYTEDDLLELEDFYMGTWYTSQTMFRAGDKFWHPYYRKILSTFQQAQQPDGQFFDHQGNSVRPTALAAIVLQAPLGYLPIYQR